MRSSYDIIVIGAGAAGLVIAIGVAKARKKVLLIEKGEYGGDCTNYGCIPSKSLIASAKTAHTLKSAHKMGIKTTPFEIEASGAFERVRKIVQEIRSHEDPPALKELGVETLSKTASFKDPHTLITDQGDQIRGKKIVIATGSHPFTPPIEGLQGTPYLTSETLFNLTEIPKSMIFVGGGPIGSELAQAMARLGTKVTLIESSDQILAREDQDARRVLYDVFQNEGIILELNARTEKVAYQTNRFSITLSNQKVLEAEALFVGVGRRPSLETLHLDKAELKWSEKGIETNAYGRTTQPHIWAVGDAIGPPFFTHFAENQGRTVLKNLLLPIKSKKSKQALPRCTYTDPEVASIGILESEALIKYGKRKIAVYSIPFTQVDRNITTGRTEGFVKIITKKWSSQILGATIVGPRAGEMLMEIGVAMFTKTPLRKLSKLIHPYPIESLAIRKAADQWLTQTILGVFRKSR